MTNSGISVVVVIIQSLVLTVKSLESFDNFREGPCSEMQMKPIKSINREWLDSLPHIVAGSKYDLYRLAFGHPDFRQIRDDEFYFDFCPQRNVSTRKGFGMATAFGKKLETFDVRTPRDSQAAMYLEALSKNPLQGWDISRQHVTLTDNKSFAFLTICWTGADQRAWQVIGTMAELDRDTQKRIMDHAQALGFKQENYAFFRQTCCKIC